MKKINLVNIICGIVLIGLGLYGVYHITSVIDFKNTVIIVNDSKTLWGFLSFMPILVTLVIGGLSLINGIIKTKALTIVNVILIAGVVGFLVYDLYGFVTIVNTYYEFMNIVSYILIGAAVLLIIGLIIQISTTKKMLKTKHSADLNIEKEL